MLVKKVGAFLINAVHVIVFTILRCYNVTILQYYNITREKTKNGKKVRRENEKIGDVEEGKTRNLFQGSCGLESTGKVLEFDSHFQVLENSLNFDIFAPRT